MSPKSLIALGIVWLGAVALWLKFGPQSFSYVWQARGAPKRIALIVAIYIFGLVYQIFIFGWLVPTGLGVYRLVKRH